MFFPALKIPPPSFLHERVRSVRPHTLALTCSFLVCVRCFQAIEPLRDRIVSLGRLPGMPRQGALGRVSELEVPDSGGHTGDIIITVFDGVRYRMKIEDFDSLLH